jgi:hypothetical protein
MAVSTSAVFELIDALLVTFRADATLSGATYNVLVIDGPPLTDLSRNNILFVGAQPSDASGSLPDGTFAQNWAEIGARARYEISTVSCELWCRAGDTDLATRRATARILFAAIESALRTNFTQGISRVAWCEIQAGSVLQENTNKGSTVAVPFTIAAKARLASQ